MQARMHQPTQKLPEHRCACRNRTSAEDVLIICLLVGAGLFPIALAIARGERWGVQPTIGMLIVFFALKQLLERYLPRVRASRRLARVRRVCRSELNSED